MLTCTTRCLDPVSGEYAAGYERPSSGQFMPLVAGIYSPGAAAAEAERLNRLARERQVDVFIDHNLRAPSAEWYQEE